MNKGLLYIALVVALLLQQLQVPLLCLTFKMNQPYLVKNLCINRNNPHSQCCAHCCLKKGFQNHAKEQKQSGFILKEQPEFVPVYSQLSSSWRFSHSDMPLFSIWVDRALLLKNYSELLQPPENV